MTASIGDRMKRYEAAYDLTLTPRSPLVIRVDGKAFHTFLRKATRPFDERFIDAMTATAQKVAADMQGFKLAYIQSDECTFMLSDYDQLATQGWFDYRLAKVISIAASSFAVTFNQQYRSRTALFDARAFIVPESDVPNVFIWRQRDWERNSVQMLTRAHYSHKECHQRNITDMHEMLHAKGVNWAHLDERLKNGTYITRDGEQIHAKLIYDDLKALIAPAEEDGNATTS